MPEQLIEKPGYPAFGGDALSDVLRHVRLSGAVQFCFMPSGDWQTDPAPSLGALGGAGAVPFHMVVEGSCWMRMDGREVILAAGDVVAFPFGTGHQLGGGRGGAQITPVRDLPPKPWRDLPRLRYGGGGPQVRLLCGFLQCDALNFRPLRQALPTLLHVRTRGDDNAAWLAATIGQIVAEADRPRSGSLSMLERLTEITFIELLRHQMAANGPTGAGWLAALTDPALGRCLALIHADPGRDWSVTDLSAEAGLSRSALADRFDAVLQTAPMRYVREWRLCLASVTLATTAQSIIAIAQDAGYGTEAAFSRAFSRVYGAPPAAWRETARRGPSA